MERRSKYVEGAVMETATLGLTDLKVSCIAYGAWELGGEWGSFDESAAIATIRHARERGITLFDTAQAYGFGASERLLSRALRHDLDRHRDEVVIATKGGLRMTGSGLVRDSSGAWLRQAVDDSLRALVVDYIDLYQVHWPDPNVPRSETASALEELVQEGKIRHVGVSNFDVGEMEEFAQTRPVEMLQPPYSLFRRDIEADVFPYTRANDIGVLVYGPLAHGLLTGSMDDRTTFAYDDCSTNPSFHGETFDRNLDKVGDLQRFASEALGTSVSELAVAWTLANPAVQVAIVGAQRAQHVDEAVAAGELHLGDDALAHIDPIMAGATAFTGPSPDQMPTR
jgi:aryl-alcohol dehydrogenase-like predicted oxidoreductase